MTQMIPDTIHPAVRSEAERRIFRLIRESQNSKEWACLHSLGLAHHGHKRRAEIDFLLLTRHGIFVLEVKGGRVARQGGVWHSMDRFGEIHQKHESPFDHAATAMFALERDIRERFETHQRRSSLLFGFGVLFPDIKFEQTGCEADGRQVFDARDSSTPFHEYIERLAEFARETDSRRRYSPRREDIEAIINYVRPDFDLVPPIGIRTDLAAKELLALEEEQYAVIDTLEQYSCPRILVQGGAGTGKTLLALEIAVRESRRTDGGILLICYNKLLARFLEESVKRRTDQSNIRVRSIYALLNELILASSFAAEFDGKRQDVTTSKLFAELYPEYAMLAMMESEVAPAEVLIIDEAQDVMRSELLDVMDGLLTGGLTSGKWRIFCDVNNQASVFNACDREALDRLLRSSQLCVLTRNHRNTTQVADETAMLSRPKIISRSSVGGIPVQYNWYESDAEQAQKLSRLLDKLEQEGVAAGRITILSARSSLESCAASLSNSGLTRINPGNILDVTTQNFTSATYATISSFKGLENDVIILTDIEDLESEWWRSVVYVGMSRARVGLHVFLPESIRNLYATRFRQWLAERASGS